MGWMQFTIHSQKVLTCPKTARHNPVRRMAGNRQHLGRALRPIHHANFYC